MVCAVPRINGDCVADNILVKGEGVKAYHNKSIHQTLLDLSTRPSGLSEGEVLSRVGTKRNETPIKRKSLGFKIIEQFTDFMIIILLIASAISIVIGIVEGQAGEIVDGCIILAIVLMNAIFGVVQEHKAEKSMEALNKLSQPECVVLRGGEKKKIKTADLVLGDVVVLEAGSIIPADLRLIESVRLKIDESSLTGESKEVSKSCESTFAENAPLGERRNMGYKGTVVCFGRGMGVVCALGEDSEFGKIASAIKESKKELSPLQKSIKDLGKILTYLILAIAVVTFIIEICITPNSVLDAFLTAVAISVAAIPESMPAVITIIMSMGVARLAKKKAIVKHLPSVETLGACNVICSDKTGTITQNKMTVTAVYDNNKLQEKRLSLPLDSPLFLASQLCNDASLQGNIFVGDPTEVALAGLGKNLGCNKKELEKLYTRKNEIPFDSGRKMMSVLIEKNGKQAMFTKGGCDNILSKCTHILIGGQVYPLGDENKEKIKGQIEIMADSALRVIGFAYKDVANAGQFEENNLIFLGLMGLIDPPRKEIKEAVRKCKRSGMKPVMITGDYAKTALAIAKQIGIAKDEGEVMTGQELEKYSDDQLAQIIQNYCVFARVSPSDKVRIVQAFKNKGKVVAMTGDGVNDAPSLKKANIGIGMGQSGTDVAKEVADIIVTDDNFATIVLAVEEGRKIYQNIQKTVKFLFSANFAELMSLFVVTLIYPQFVFLYPVQILFTNLITDSLPAIALGVEEPELDLMNQPPRDVKKGLFSNGNGVAIIILGALQTILVVLSYVLGLKFSPEIATTMAFYTLNINQMFYLASMRTRSPFYKSKPYKNKWFLIAVGFCFALVALFAFTPLQSILKLVSLAGSQWLIVLVLSSSMLVLSEVYKLLENLITKKRSK
ncbi:MAG: calcium-translocating P-type ATPase, PMCA-type [Clostridia bacterium]|nr:calcium-translocating P-type ATPase, PMCA-type [Clostridia bacterium]